MRSVSLAASLLLVLSARAAERKYIQYSESSGLRQADWNTWVRQEDERIRRRLVQGELDSMVNLLLFGTSFTSQPRIRIEEMAEASRSGVLKARVVDLLNGLRAPGGNERLQFVRGLLRNEGVDVDRPEAGVYILQNVERVLRELREFAQRVDTAKASGGAAEFGERSRLFRDRGVSLDTSILPGLGIEQALRVVKRNGLLEERGVARAAVIGPGLDFTDWDEGYDYYPQQTLQPFALADSLLRLALARDAAPAITVFDISARVLEHLAAARKRAAYTVQLPRDPARRWLPATLDYWSTFGREIGTPAAAIRPPPMLGSIETRAVQIRPAVVLACQPVDLNIIVERLALPEAERFDLVVATNILVYYDVREQSLALQNVAAMLKPGGLLLVNSKLPELPGAMMRQVGSTAVRYGEAEASGDSVLFYQRFRQAGDLPHGRH